MDVNEAPVYYNDLSQDELQLLIYYNQIMINKAVSPESQEYYSKKINYISSLIEE